MVTGLTGFPEALKLGFAPLGFIGMAASGLRASRLHAEPEMETYSVYFPLGSLPLHPLERIYQSSHPWIRSHKSLEQENKTTNLHRHVSGVCVRSLDRDRDRVRKSEATPNMSFRSPVAISGASACLSRR